MGLVWGWYFVGVLGDFYGSGTEN
ncbi:protein of unknown function [Brochothrix thermosphacta]|nr:protein of unknown function [Brochothrix thermosphacta]